MSIQNLDLPMAQIKDLCDRWQITEFALFGSGDRVGWRKDGEWASHSTLTGDLEKSLRGEFPAGLGRGWLSSLSQRLVDCSTSQS